MPKWQLETTDQFLRDVEWCTKNHPRELEGMMNNVKRYASQLCNAKNSRCVQAGYLHFEEGGVVALDQRGTVKGSLQEMRLYTFADDQKNILYLITIGNKKTQPADIAASKLSVERIRTSAP